jgi:outer membrane protein OmpA-like peptidoglycan-associated protein
LQGAFFDYGRSDPDPQAVAAHFPALTESGATDFGCGHGRAVGIEGHCDERGSAEYNLALGALRTTGAAGIGTRVRTW